MSSDGKDTSQRSGTRSAEQLISRVGASIGSPLGILLILPGLVSAVGLFTSLLGEYALRSSNREVARDHMVEQARLAASSVGDALQQAEPMLDRLHELSARHDPSEPFGEFAHGLLDLMKGRPGVTYISASFPDGTFQGAYLDTDGSIRFQDSRVHEDGTQVDRYDYGRRGELTLKRLDRTGYDPRVRGFYLLATSEQQRVWTAPYLFYGSHAAGITRAAPVYTDDGPNRKLHAVITIDFDVNGLSNYLSGHQLSGTRALLYANDGSILAYATNHTAAPPLASDSGSPVRFQDLSDPVLQAFFKAAGTAPESRAVSLKVGDEQYLGAVAPVMRDRSLPWTLAYLVPERQFLRGLYRYEDQSLIVGGTAVLISALLAFLFARHILRVRAEAAEAKQDAREARKLAREARAEARELGSYRLVANLGRGGMGEVWRAQHRLLAREAAIKLIKTDEGSEVTQSMRERFRREAEALARLRSRNTIELFDYGVADDGTFFLVMELLDGVDFDTLVAKHGTQPPARVVHLLVQACNSLAEAHAAGLVHRDIKPANLFVCRAAEEVDVVKVLDFGLVRAALDVGEPLLAPLDASTLPHGPLLTNPNGMIGTPAFMAPEQVQGQPVDGRADLYALGGVAYWLLTGRLVYERQSAVEQLLAQVHAPVPELRAQLGEEVPEALLQLIASCLSKSPSERPADARVLGRALKAISFAPEQAWTDERAQQWWRSRRPRPSEHPPLLEPRELAVAAPTVSIKRG
jgi:serine/threonine protein kinase